MNRLTLLAASALIALPTAAHAQTELRVHYAQPTLWSDVQEKLEAAFEAQNPDVDVVYDAPAESYADGVQRLLREAVAGDLPDVAFLGLNRWRILEDRDLLQPLDPFMETLSEAQASGYTPALLSLGKYEGAQYALAASASTLVIYVNPELVEEAGGSLDDFPTDFESLVALASSIDALADSTSGAWIDAHDWRFQSLLGSYGGRPMSEDESDITFDSEAGIAAAEVYQDLAQEAGMEGYSGEEARQAFAAGELGLYIDSSSYLTRLEEAVGDRFEVTLMPMVVAAEDTSTVYFPTGGSAVVMLTEDEAKQDLAFEFMTFVTGPDAAKIVVENTGYAPTNAIVLEDESYLGAFYETNQNAKRAHEQVAAYSGPWYAYPGDEGVAVTDLIAAALVEVREGAEAEATIEQLAETVRDELDMN